MESTSNIDDANSQTPEDQWLKKWGTISTIMLLVGIFSPDIQAGFGEISISWFWDSFIGQPANVVILLLITTALLFLPIYFINTQRGFALAGTLLAYSAFGLLMVPMILGSLMSGLFSMGGVGSAVLMGGLSVTLSFFLLSFILIGTVGVSNHLSKIYSEKTFPFAMLKFFAGLGATMMVLMLFSETPFGLAFMVFFQASAWTEGWYVLIPILLILAYFVVNTVHGFSETLGERSSLLLRITIIGVPILVLIGGLINSSGEIAAISLQLYIFAKFICLAYGVTLMYTASLSRLIDFCTTPESAAKPTESS